jgi:hypothetical protein
MQRVVSVLLAVLVVCGVAAQGVYGVGEKKSAKELIVGKWRPTDFKERRGVKDATVEFTKDGKVAASVTLDENLAKIVGKDQIKSTGSYKFVEDDVVETKMKSDGDLEEKVERKRVVATDTTLTSTDLEGNDKGKVV